MYIYVYHKKVVVFGLKILSNTTGSYLRPLKSENCEKCRSCKEFNDLSRECSFYLTRT